MNEQSIKIYTCQRMTGRMMDEMRVEADMLIRVLGNYGFQILNPVIEEKIPYLHEPLPFGNGQNLKLTDYWKRDKEMIREADILLDFNTLGKSDGTNNEVAYARYCLWKPVIRVWDGPGGMISKIEDDLVVETLNEAIDLIKERWGTYEKLGKWRKEMWMRSYPKWHDYQQELRHRYGIQPVSYLEEWY